MTIVSTDQIVHGDAECLGGRAELVGRPPDALGIRRCRFDPDVEVLGASGHTVNRHGVRADDEEAGLRVEECPDHLEPIVGHQRSTIRTGISERE